MTSRGPIIILELSYSPVPRTAYAREMSTKDLETTLGNWQGWKITHGSGRTDQALAFKRTAMQQIRRIRAELQRRNKEN